jgi:hypothetical protein
MARYDDTVLVFATPVSGTQVKYGFRTNIEANYRTQLSQTLVDLGATLPVGLVIGANAPKPPRASKVVATGTKSSFCSFPRQAQARAAGWRVGSPKLRSARATTRSQVYYLTIRGIKYAWNLPTATASRLSGQLAQLGVRAATANDRDLVFGSEFPKPPRVAVSRGSGDSINIHSTFCDPSRLDSLPAGFQVISSGKYLP